MKILAIKAQENFHNIYYAILSWGELKNIENIKLSQENKIEIPLKEMGNMNKIESNNDKFKLNESVLLDIKYFEKVYLFLNVSNLNEIDDKDIFTIKIVCTEE